MKIILAINYVDYSDASNYSRKQCQEIALFVLNLNKPDNVKVVSFNYPDENVKIPPSFMISKSLKRDPVKDFKAERRLPYIKEIFNSCAEMDCDIFGFINSDILIPIGFFDIFKENKDVYLFNRIDIGETVGHHKFNDKHFRIIWDKHPGCDAFFFNKEWWLNNRDNFSNDLIIGEPTWDSYYMAIVPHLTNNYVLKRDVYHTWHEPKWNDKTIGGKHNLDIWNGLKKELNII